MQNSKTFPGKILQIPGFRGRNVCFRSKKMYQNSPTAMLDSNIFPGTIPRTPVLGERKICFCSPKMHHNSHIQQCRIQKFSGVNIPDLRFKGRKICFRFPKMYQNSPTAMQNSKIFPGTIDIPQTPVLREMKICFSSPKCTKTLQ